MNRQATPQLEDGYTRISNELLEAICNCDFNGSQMRVLMLFIRMSYGYGKKQTLFSIEYVQQKTGLSDRNVRRAVNSLIDGNVFVVKKDATRISARVLELNKRYWEWKAFLSDKNDQNDQTELTGNNDNDRTKMTKWADKNDQNDRTELTAYKERHKENIKKDCQTQARKERENGPNHILTLEDIIGYCQSAGLCYVDARRFYEYYTKRNWRTGGRPIEDWKGLLRKWNKQDKESVHNAQKITKFQVHSTGFSNFQQRDYDFDELEKQLLQSQKERN